MKKLILGLIISITLNVTAQNTWKVDNAHSSITFSVSHFMISEVTGNFGKFDITATTNEKFETPSFEVVIDAATINTNQSGRDNHLKSADFFDVAKHANIVFKSASFKSLEGKEFETTGNITIKGITKEVVFKGKLNGVIDTKSGKKKAGLKLTSVIKREDFNVGKGMNPVGKEVNVTINVEMNQQ
ncbi:polyisoprenoid-binding protein [Tenacibaculum sp. Bg11-29]|uniref:YceI family protein n=1 Tax=Tenacibaculum sp. Bg11-29 TaxID=2058306 RepID=UPI000C33E11C|nr:YceI family protein [Tenacibaculum sp. Bg11-29]PKH50042.1 polyisoprenoid-binding protein [Tenacibaculum sp. Bg11-29]